MARTISLTTGLDDFNLLFDSRGIIVDPDVGSSILIEGGAGLGKTTLALQISSNAVKNNIANCLYYSFDQTGKELDTMLNSFDWGLKVNNLIWSQDSDSRIGNFNIVEVTNPAIVDIDNLHSVISENVRMLKEKLSKPVIVVVDSIGAIKDMGLGERAFMRKVIGKLRGMKAIMILINEHSDTQLSHPTEYLTNVVIDLQRRFVPHGISEFGGAYIPKTMMEIIKSRNQRSHRGPHEFEILLPGPSGNSGFVVYPALQSSIIKRQDSVDSSKQKGSRTPKEERALFGIEILDEALGGGSDDLGIPYGKSLLVKGKPGCYKTELGIKFLVNERQKESRLLFISCRIDKDALSGLDIFGDAGEKRVFLNRIDFIDARNPFKTPEQIMAEIRDKVKKSKSNPVRRAIIFGIGMLDTLPAFRPESLTFLQVLANYFRTEGISGVFIDWPREKSVNGGNRFHVMPTELAGDFMSYALDINKDKNRQVTLVRRDHRFANKVIGNLTFEKNSGTLKILKKKVSAENE